MLQQHNTLTVIRCDDCPFQHHSECTHPVPEGMQVVAADYGDDPPPNCPLRAAPMLVVLDH